MLLGIKRVYEKRSPLDGQRILVDRLWPRGVRKSTNNVDQWMKDVAPSNELRKWFNHDPEKWPAFREKYIKELQNSHVFAKLLDAVKANDVTLVYAAKDTEHNNAVVLSELINERLQKQ